MMGFVWIVALFINLMCAFALYGAYDEISSGGQNVFEAIGTLFWSIIALGIGLLATAIALSIQGSSVGFNKRDKGQDEKLDLIIALLMEGQQQDPQQERPRQVFTPSTTDNRIYSPRQTGGGAGEAGEISERASRDIR